MAVDSSFLAAASTPYLSHPCWVMLQEMSSSQSNGNPEQPQVSTPSSCRGEGPERPCAACTWAQRVSSEWLEILIELCSDHVSADLSIVDSERMAHAESMTSNHMRK